MGRLEGKTAIVVGAGQTPGPTIGNGRAMALLFAREGAEVVCVDRELARANETVSAIKAEGGRASSIQADIVDASDVSVMITSAVERLGRIDVLVNNVGVGLMGDGPAHLASEEGFDATLDINLKGMWLTIRTALPIMREAGGGSIVNISSLASVAGDSMIGYMVSKAAVNRLTIAVASANAEHGVRCNAVLPGLMDTPMAIRANASVHDVSDDVVREMRNSRVPLKGGMGDAWDTAYAALFLASDEAKHVTGVLLPVDGGFTTRVGAVDR
ncbi:SDR family oxidoreductase [Phenylobacterium sp. LjRoot164]|uniref:SDR family NAD(P)-dependent oxidoreductase n=1 Tax=unclassified Phenylobacterium TaxID=2640670 RepID=UPI003ECCC35D